MTKGRRRGRWLGSECHSAEYAGFQTQGSKQIQRFKKHILNSLVPGAYAMEFPPRLSSNPGIHSFFPAVPSVKTRVYAFAGYSGFE